MHRESWFAMAWCLVVAAAVAVMVEVHRHREPPTTVTAYETRSITVETTRAAEKPAPKAEYAGNVNTHKFHRKGCRYFGCPNCKAYFATREDAIKAGFQPCGTCDP